MLRKNADCDAPKQTPVEQAHERLRNEAFAWSTHVTFDVDPDFLVYFMLFSRSAISDGCASLPVQLTMGCAPSITVFPLTYASEAA